ncbi:MAG: serine/threonine transporter SstT [Eubacteriales bacterium]|nr:serine/threonine transporter SstT [Eubacteriales bacterium]
MIKTLGFLRKLNLIQRILIGLVLGAALGLLFPAAQPIALLGTVFVSALCAIAPVLVFVLVICSLANAKNEGKSNIGAVVVLYLGSTLIAAIVAVIGSFLFPLKLTLSASTQQVTAPGSLMEIAQDILLSAVANPVEAIASGNYISILLWSVILGIAFKMSGDGTKKVLADIADAVSHVVGLVIALAPLGVLGLVYETISKRGLAVFADYGMLIALLLGCMAFVALVTNPFLVFLATRKNPYPLVFTCLKESGITAFFTRSSAANIPINMALCKKLGLDEDNYSVSIPLGATINMDGAAVTVTVLAMVAAHTQGIAISLPTAIVLSILSTLAACGTSGVTGGSLLLVPMACSLFGLPVDTAMQIVGVGFVISVIQDSVETALNSSGDALFTATAEYYHRRKAGLPMHMNEKVKKPEDTGVSNQA